MLLASVLAFGRHVAATPQISVFLAADASAQDAAEIGQRLQQQQGIAEYRFVARDETPEALPRDSGAGGRPGRVARQPVSGRLHRHHPGRRPGPVGGAARRGGRLAQGGARATRFGVGQAAGRPAAPGPAGGHAAGGPAGRGDRGRHLQHHPAADPDAARGNRGQPPARRHRRLHPPSVLLLRHAAGAVRRRGGVADRGRCGGSAAPAVLPSRHPLRHEPDAAAAAAGTVADPDRLRRPARLARRPPLRQPPSAQRRRRIGAAPGLPASCDNNSCRPVRFLAASVALLAVACHSPALHAAALGEARALSAIGEPLRVRIDLVMEPGERPDAIKARVASPSIDAGSAAPAGNALTAAVVATGEGRAGVVVRSTGPVYRPYVELIVALSSPAGRSDRSFVVALPPVRPGIAAPGPAAAPGARDAAPCRRLLPRRHPPPLRSHPRPLRPPLPLCRCGAWHRPLRSRRKRRVKPPQRQAAEKAAPPPLTAAQPTHAEPNRTRRAPARPVGKGAVRRQNRRSRTAAW
ncbi:MAG: permease-like cell division protein FtsX [Comamonadaceae bacterium]|nr:permease-like cell division protein FtsX [Comamonadaceae bacterium]